MLEMFQRAVEVKPNRLQAWYDEGWNLEGRGDSAGGPEVFTRGAQLGEPKAEKTLVETERFW